MPEKRKEEYRIAYICDGLVPECSGKVGCFKFQGVPMDDEMTCWHTTDPEHAVYGTCCCPEDWVPTRFKIVGDAKDGIKRYFEDWEIPMLKDEDE